MSTMTWVESVAKILIEPFVPAGKIAAFALIRESEEFRVETVGRLCPVGHTVR